MLVDGEDIADVRARYSTNQPTARAIWIAQYRGA
jgi:hypothetical protein